MKKWWLLLGVLIIATAGKAQHDERQVADYFSKTFPRLTVPVAINFTQCKYKPGKSWQYVIACTTTVNKQSSVSLLFAEKQYDSVYNFEPFHFLSVSAFENVNVDDSRDGVEELFITTTKDTGNIAQKTIGVYSLKKGLVDTLIAFHPFSVRTMKAPYFRYQPGAIVEQEDICQLTDLTGDGKMDISNRIHQKICNKDPLTGEFIFDYETVYEEYKFVKGKFTRMKVKKQELPPPAE